MSRCFPFPPPGYEREHRTEDLELLKEVRLPSPAIYCSSNFKFYSHRPCYLSDPIQNGFPNYLLI